MYIGKCVYFLFCTGFSVYALLFAIWGHHVHITWFAATWTDCSPFYLVCEKNENDFSAFHMRHSTASTEWMRILFIES